MDRMTNYPSSSVHTTHVINLLGIFQMNESVTHSDTRPCLLLLDIVLFILIISIIHGRTKRPFTRCICPLCGAEGSSSASTYTSHYPSHSSSMATPHYCCKQLLLLRCRSVQWRILSRTFLSHIQYRHILSTYRPSIYFPVR